jgi:hypothetical protein
MGVCDLRDPDHPICLSTLQQPLTFHFARHDDVVIGQKIFARHLVDQRSFFKIPPRQSRLRDRITISARISCYRLRAYIHTYMQKVSIFERAEQKGGEKKTFVSFVWLPRTATKNVL